MNDKKMTLISGIIVFWALIAFFASILWLSGQNIFLTKRYSFYIKFTDVIGLRDHSPVYMRGYRIGWTKDVYFERDYVKIRVDIKKKYAIPKNSSFEINTLNFIGEKAITITPGNAIENVEKGDIIIGENKDLMIMAKEILTEIKQKIFHGEFDDELENITQAIASFKDFFNKMNEKAKNLDIVALNNQVKIIGKAAGAFEDFLKSAKDETKKFSANTESSLQKLDHTLEQLNQLAADVRGIVQQINSGQGSAGQLVKNEQFFEKLTQTINELNLFLQDIKKNPKKYVRFSIF